MVFSSVLSGLRQLHDWQRFKADLLWLWLAAVFSAALLSLISSFELDSQLVDMASHFQLQYFAISFSGVLIALLRLREARGSSNGNWKQCSLLLFSLLGVYCSASFLAPYYAAYEFSDLQSERSPGETKIFAATGCIKTLSANVFFANKRAEEVIQTVLGVNPDIAVFMEVNQNWVDLLQSLKGTLPFSREVPRSDAFGIAVFSKYDLSNVQALNGEGLYTPSLAGEISVGEDKLTFVATHPVPPALPPASAERAQARDRQLAALANYLQASSNPKLLAGDLNTTGWSISGRKFLRQSQLRDTRHSFGINATWPRWLLPFGVPIDHVLTSEDFRVVDVRAVAVPGSDHAAIFVEACLISEPD